MALQWFGADRLRDAEEEIALRLLRAAVYVETTHQNRVGVAGSKKPPLHSKPGEYPRKITGLGQANVIHWPETPAEVVSEKLRVKVGARKISLIDGLPHLIFLEERRDRLGWRKTIADIKPQVQTLIEG